MKQTGFSPLGGVILEGLGGFLKVVVFVFSEMCFKTVANVFIPSSRPVFTAAEIVESMAMESFLRGSTHQKAAVQVLNKEPTDLTDALHQMKIHVQNFDTVFGTPKKSVKQVTFDDSSDEEYSVRAIDYKGKKQKPTEELFC